MSEHGRSDKKKSSGGEDDELEIEGLPEGETEHPITEGGDPMPV
jgi:hypothetical protein